jgi:two-component system, OmpR family, response regulator
MQHDSISNNTTTLPVGILQAGTIPSPAMKNLLLVEDDASIARQLLSHFQKAWNITWAATSDEAYAAIDRTRFDIAVLDRMLPDGDGVDIAAYLYDVSYATRVLMLSQRSAVVDRIEGLEHGADDYLAKPFSLPELKLKLHILHRHSKHRMLETYTGSCFTFTFETGRLEFGDGRATQLRKKEALILTCLIRHKHALITREALIADVWGGTELPTQTTLDVYIRRIRILLHPFGDCIQTRRGYGYIFTERTAATA